MGKGIVNVPLVTGILLGIIIVHIIQYDGVHPGSLSQTLGITMLLLLSYLFLRKGMEKGKQKRGRLV
ncbi:hypothetical protein [Alkalicoccus chagannorensis]|uniref:hypothetical protein n=1 Tax=Alkalicoccus chagannorensis TaxID=427072 RepID=UPI00040A4759|nr:hypothetical protein [Alkalicoccus chagannorensis]